MFTYITSVSEFWPVYITAEHWGEFPELYSRFSLVTYFICSVDSLYT